MRRPLSTISPNTTQVKRKSWEDKVEHTAAQSTIQKASSNAASHAATTGSRENIHAPPTTGRKPKLQESKLVAFPPQPSREVKPEGLRHGSMLTKLQDRCYVDEFRQSMRRQRNIDQDPWVRKGSIKPDSVVCERCRQRITLKKRKREDEDVQGGCNNSGWAEHKEKCYLLYVKWCEEQKYDPKKMRDLEDKRGASTQKI
ncbi:hypothetical protein BDZ89DRAFT_1061941 [Hymenopellis radicata]|nr:hypothetical protein BDZ89DRAFT_1061941 [Hymenopellis radicata]